MNEIKRDSNEMDAAEMLEKHREEHPVEDQTEGYTEEWCGEIVVEVGSEVRRWALRQKRDASALAVVSWLTVVACAAACMTGIWEPIVTGIAAVNLMMTGAWCHKAKAGWSV